MSQKSHKQLGPLLITPGSILFLVAVSAIIISGLSRGKFLMTAVFLSLVGLALCLPWFVSKFILKNQDPVNNYSSNQNAACPLCGFRAADAYQEIEHMENAHPEVISERLKGLEYG